MKKQFLLILIIFLSLSGNFTKASEVNNITIEGNKRITRGTILDKLGVSLGIPFTLEQLNEGVKKLYTTGLFQDVSTNLDRNNLIIKVIENPIVRQIIIKEEGGSLLSKKSKTAQDFLVGNKVRKLLITKPAIVLNKVFLSKDKENLEKYFRYQGSYNTQVNLKVIKVNDNFVDIVVNIKHGVKKRIVKINFVNNRNFSDVELRQIIASKQYNLSRLFGNQHYYVKDRIELDEWMLKNFYTSKGYTTFQVLKTKVKELKLSEIELTFYLQEGPKFEIDKISIKTDKRGINLTPLLKLITVKKGETFNENDITKTRDNITAYLERKGYMFSQVIPIFDFHNNLINVTFKIIEGKKLFIRNINITGNNFTRDHVIRREIPFLEGEVFNVNNVSQAKYKIANLRLFNAVDLTPIAVEENKIDLNVAVKEVSTGYVNASASYNSDVGLVGTLGFQDSNILGTGNELGLFLQSARKTIESNLIFNKPYVFNSDITGGINVFYTREKRSQHNNLIDFPAEKILNDLKVGQIYNSYDSVKKGIVLSASYDITPQLNNLLFYSFKYDEIKNVGPHSSEYIKEEEGVKTASSIGYSLTYSALDNVLLVKNGFKINVKQSIAGLGGSLNYITSEGMGKLYKSFAEDFFVFSLTSKIGYVFGYNQQNVGLDQRFFMGGRDIRGFDFRGVGPRDTDTVEALGGKLYLINSAQIEFPLSFWEDSSLKGFLFLDSGTLTKLDIKNTSKIADSKIADSSKMRLSCGFGLSILTPLGPLVIDFGYPLRKESYDQTKTTRVDIGGAPIF